jgi:L-lysine 6-transaminase
MTKTLHERASNHILVDHFDVVYDINKSFGNFIVDKTTGRQLLDAFSFIASNPIGHNHPKMFDPAFESRLLRVARTNPSNSDILTEEYVEFLETFFKIGVPSYFRDSFFIAGGSLAVENAMKAAFDWKYRKLKERGIVANPDDLKVLHFKNSFHGRSGYTLTVTNTADPRKYDLFPKFANWPRLEAPHIHELISPEEQAKRDVEFLQYADDVITKLGHSVAAILIEPIQGEGGDNHFTKQFHQGLRKLADDKEAILIYDEVQTGVGLTGKMWAHEHYDIKPDIISFGKKMQVCGILSGDRIREVQKNVFEEKSRINSTWGGNLTDFVRAQRYLEIIHEDNLIDNAAVVGEYLLAGLKNLGVLNPRGKGLLCSFDMPTPQDRDAFVKRCYDNGLFLLGCGTISVRVRPSLTFSKSNVDQLLDILKKSF